MGGITYAFYSELIDGLESGGYLLHLLCNTGGKLNKQISDICHISADQLWGKGTIVWAW